MNIGEKIAQLRRNANITQEELADSLGVTRQSVSRWESGEAYPDMSKIGKLADVLETNCDYLLRDDVNEKGEKIKIVTETSTLENYVNRLILTLLSFVPFVGPFIGFFSLKKEEKRADNLLRKLMIVGTIISTIFTLLFIAIVIYGLIYNIMLHI